MQKRVLTIQDYSCMGRCSLTVALPTLSACQVEAVSIPTAVLSNHTAYDSWTYLDMTNQMEDIANHWDNYNHHFQTIYTGYLSTTQIDIVIRLISKLKEEDTFVLVDPAMADNGKLYKGFDGNHVKEMKKLISYADIIVPNLTEASLLTNTKYKEKYSIEELKKIAISLSKEGPKIVILSGISLKEGSVGVFYYNKEKEEFNSYQTEALPGKYHGTGDLFASALVGLLNNNIKIDKALKYAHDFVHLAMKYTIDDNLDGILYGVEFEKALPLLIKAIEENK